MDIETCEDAVCVVHVAELEAYRRRSRKEGHHVSKIGARFFHYSDLLS